MLAELKPNFKRMVLSRFNELEDVSYITENVWMSNFQCNYNCINNLFVAPIMTKTVAKGQN